MKKDDFSPGGMIISSQELSHISHGSFNVTLIIVTGIESDMAHNTLRAYDAQESRAQRHCSGENTHERNQLRLTDGDVTAVFGVTNVGMYYKQVSLIFFCRK